jgi:hypothetical protein
MRAEGSEKKLSRAREIPIPNPVALKAIRRNFSQKLADVKQIISHL